MIDGIMEKKDKIRICNLREGNMQIGALADQLHEKGDISNEVLLLMKHLLEIQRILYTLETDRCQRSILRFNLQTFLYFIYLKINVGEQENFGSDLTYDQIFKNIYLHNTVVHASFAYRIIAMSFVNTEMDERTIWDHRNVTQQTSNKKPDHVAINSMTRIAFKEKDSHTVDSSNRITSDSIWNCGLESGGPTSTLSSGITIGTHRSLR